jgi:hypothetical protein
VRYVLLLYANEVEDQRANEAEAVSIRRGQCAFVAELARIGSHRSWHALEHTTSATTVRLRGGETLLCDGPFEETREQLLGFHLIEARDLDEAIAIAGRAPEAQFGSVEIRPVRGVH